MNKQQIKELALANGFKLKGQPDGTFDLNPYVYEFASALALAAEAEAGRAGFVAGAIAFSKAFKVPKAVDACADQYADSIRKGGTK